MLSAVILTHNEEKNIAQAVKSAFRVAEEVWVIDSHSTDKTVEIAEKEKAKVVQIIWEGWVKARNKALDFITFDHVLFLDADEILSQELEDAILLEKKEGFTKTVYSLQRLNYLGSKAIKHGAWFPDIKVRLFEKSSVIWKGGHVHEWADCGSVSPFILHGFLHHFSYSSPEELKQRTEKYAALAAKSLKNKPKTVLFLKMLFSPPVRFVRDYVIKAGFKDGSEGFLIAGESGREVFLKNKIALFTAKG